MGLYNYIYDEIYHFLSGGDLGSKFESLVFFPTNRIKDQPT